MLPIVGCWSITTFICDKPITFEYEKTLFEKSGNKFAKLFFLYQNIWWEYLLYCIVLFIIYAENSKNGLELDWIYRTSFIYWEYIVKEGLNCLKKL